jgi:hypothetical protein
MDVNKLLDTIQTGLRDVEDEILRNLDDKAKAQRAKPVEVRLRELETIVARLRWDLSGLKNSMSVYDMRLESARNDASRAVAEVRELAGARTRTSQRKRR